MSSGRVHGGLIAAFDDAEALVAAVRIVRRESSAEIETYTPYAVEALDAILPHPPSPIPRIMAAACLLGASSGFLLQYYGSAVGYPLNIGGRPLNSWPAFVPSSFELGVLAALLAGFAALCIHCRLNRLYDPVFALPGFERASQDLFLLRATGAMDQTELERLTGLLAPHRPRSIGTLHA